MTTRERILVLADRGDDPYLIAARLGLSVEQVVETLRDPHYTPPELGGGSSEIVYASISGNSFVLESTGLLMPIPYEAEAHVQNPVLTLSTVKKAAAGDVLLESELIAPSLSESWVVHAAFTILNLGSSDLATITGEKALASDAPTFFASSELTPGELGEDLTLVDLESPELAQVKTAAGGVFALQAVFKFSLAG